jgi:hypothetical protein
MVDDYHGERNMILNENDLWSIKKKRQKRIPSSKCSMFQKAFIGNVISNIYVDRDALV